MDLRAQMQQRLLAFSQGNLRDSLVNSFAFDYLIRARLGGNSLIWSVLEATAVPSLGSSIESHVVKAAGRLCVDKVLFAARWMQNQDTKQGHSARHALAIAERIRCRAILDTLVFAYYQLQILDVAAVLAGCDCPTQSLRSGSGADHNPKGFWRVDKDKDPELRHTVLTLVAFYDLEEKISACGGDREKGIEVFLNQNDGEGWMLPETLRLADYGLGHDERAKEYQPVASRLGPRFYDWQLAQGPEESWRECHLHARNLLGKEGYFNFLAEVLRDTDPGGWREALVFACDLSTKDNLLIVFTTAIGQLSPDEWQNRLDEVQPILSERGFSLDAADMTQILVKALRRVPEEVGPEGLSVARGLVGEAGYHKILAYLEVEDHDKIAEPVEPYGTSTGKMTQMRLFD